MQEPPGDRVYVVQGKKPCRRIGSPRHCTNDTELSTTLFITPAHILLFSHTLSCHDSRLENNFHYFPQVQFTFIFLYQDGSLCRSRWEKVMVSQAVSSLGSSWSQLIPMSSPDKQKLEATALSLVNVRFFSRIGCSWPNNQCLKVHGFSRKSSSFSVLSFLLPHCCCFF